METYRGYKLRYELDSTLRAELQGRFMALSADQDTRDFVDWALDDPQPVATSKLRDMATKSVDFYDANAIADAYHMQTLTRGQWKSLLAPHFTDDIEGRSLLDIGAGDGRVTDALAPLFSQVLTTETSAPMVSRLRERGFEARHVDVVSEPILDRMFDLVAIQNVVDRTPRPTSLIRSAMPLLAPGGLMAVLVPLPIKPVVFVKGGTARPEEPLPTAETWEANANFFGSWLNELGLEVVSLTRAPYLCRGDRNHPLIVLDDAVFLCRPRFTAPVIGAKTRVV